MRPGWSAEARKRWLEGEPAPNPADVFRRICERVALFLHLPKTDASGTTATLALWCIHTYCYQVWPAVPYLHIGGPLQSGKTRVFEILSQVAFRSYVTSNPSAAFLFRTMHSQGITWFQDEAERLRDARDPAIGEINAMLLAGYKRGGTASRLEPVGETFRPVSFQVFGPKALACIASVPPALASRCIPVMMFRAPPGSEKPKRRIDADPATWERLRDDLHALAMEHGPAFLAMPGREDVCPSGIDGRHYELWQPLLALAAWIQDHGGGGLLKLMQEHALAVIDAGKEDTTPEYDEALLKLLAESIQFGERPTPGEILDKAKAAEPEAFKRWSPRAVSGHLKRYGLTTKKSHGRKVYNQVSLDDLRNIETSYGLDLGLNEEE